MRLKPLFFVVLVAAAPVAHAQEQKELPPNVLQKIQDTGVPENCEAPMAEVDMRSQIPYLLQLGSDAAQITDIHVMYNAHSYVYYPNLWRLDCDIRVTFSNGLNQIGRFSEWINQYDQKMVSYDPGPQP